MVQQVGERIYFLKQSFFFGSLMSIPYYESLTLQMQVEPAATPDKGRFEICHKDVIMDEQ